ncbi:cyclin-dependent kinase 11B-like [Tachysurus vachellii]|uniref:cyclin-dependent kinase 11B-like n=1 Tax=Tachysurus vachellii TaxID=175792 RepID=UPI00296B40A1|nr:cyclin-dependent kinase 11B-like [Tachysurus vachellii]
MKRKGKQRMQENLYEILDWLENERGQMIMQFWSCVFQEHILQKYPLLRQLQTSLLNVKMNISQFNLIPLEQLITFFRRKKTEISSQLDDPQLFFDHLKDHGLISEDVYQKLIKMKSKDRRQKAVYKVLESLEKEPNKIKEFWSCVFEEHIMQKYPFLRSLQRRLDESFLLSQNLPWVEKLTGNEEKQVEQKKSGTKRKKSVDETEEEDAGPFSVSSSSQKKLLIVMDDSSEEELRKSVHSDQEEKEETNDSSEEELNESLYSDQEEKEETNDSSEEELNESLYSDQEEKEETGDSHEEELNESLYSDQEEKEETGDSHEEELNESLYSDQEEKEETNDSSEEELNESLYSDQEEKEETGDSHEEELNESLYSDQEEKEESGDSSEEELNKSLYSDQEEKEESGDSSEEELNKSLYSDQEEKEESDYSSGEELRKSLLSILGLRRKRRDSSEDNDDDSSEDTDDLRKTEDMSKFVYMALTEFGFDTPELEDLQFNPAVLPVSCGSVREDLYKSRFAGGSRSKSIHTEEGWITPEDFVKQELTLTDRHWKKDVLCHGKTLDYLVKNKVLCVHPLFCDCQLCCLDEAVSLKPMMAS